MVDFKKRLLTKAVESPTDPVEIYSRLDRASDKGPLRPAQEGVLRTWHESLRAARDVVLKLHTGEGKTLIGLLVLQAKLNEARATGAPDGRALYLCPNLFLVRQTLAQAKQFGVSCVGVDENRELPSDFLDGKAILVAPVQKLFNGLTKFGLGARSERVDSLVLDDAHACIDVIKNACEITLRREHQAYVDLVALFESDLREQGVGRFAEIREHEAAAFLPVPYWAWVDRLDDVATILARHHGTPALKFVWPLLRDKLRDCRCIVSGTELVISPYRPPLEQFGAFANARHRVFMSATISDDSFLVRGLGLELPTVKKPLSHEGARWSGEKMVIIPSDIDGELTQPAVVYRLAKPVPKRSTGCVAIVPSFEAAKSWTGEGARALQGEDMDDAVERLRNGECQETVVVANRYDGIDLPDDACRVLVLDGKPFGDALLDRYMESCRPGSDAIAMRVARTIEQGMGRAVRGEKDYCAILLIGAALVRAVRSAEGRSYFSPQTRAQLEIGLRISALARDEVQASNGTVAPPMALLSLLQQLLRRDEGWKDYYAEQMSSLVKDAPPARMSEVFAKELEAELSYERGDVDGAVDRLQKLLDDGTWDPSDRGWYLQEMARYQYQFSKSESFRLQAAAHRANHLLLRPKNGVAFARLEPTGQRRAERILAWVQRQPDYSALIAVVDDILGALRFGVQAESFERAMHELGGALGFACERPDAEWKEGPDNLWVLREGEYLLFECKSEVLTTRAEIAKSETGQMNNSAAWFKREYPGVKVTRIIVIPTKKVPKAAGFNEPTVVLRQKKLGMLTGNVRRFFGEFRALDLRDVSEDRVQTMLEMHHLRVEDLQAFYYENPVEP